jgi:DNA-binding NarL/FixJ family response regulator
LSENEKNRIKELSQGTTSENGSFDSISTLSDRQLQIFTLVGKGLGTVEIAKKLNLSIKTIDTHKENIKAKLHCASSAELRQMAIEWTNKAV